MGSKKKKKIDFLCLATALILFLNLIPANADAIKNFSCPQTVISASSPKSIDNLAGHFDNKIKIIFSDIDGTLIPFGQEGKIPESVNYGIKKLKQVQIPLILATGRSYWEAKQIADKMGNDRAYIITLQGAEVLNPNGSVIYQDNIKNKDFKKILKEIESFNNSHKQNSKFLFFVNGKPYSTEGTDFPYIFQSITTIKSINDLGSNFTSNQIKLYNPNNENLKSIQAHLKKNFPNYNINMVSDCYCEITSPTATKGNAAKKLAKILGVDLKNSAAFGDSENDISMLKQVKISEGLAVAVGNAMEPVKYNANFITSTVNENGFAKAVDKILINNACLK